MKWSCALVAETEKNNGEGRIMIIPSFIRKNWGLLYSTQGLALTKANYYIREDYQARMEIDNQE